MQASKGVFIALNIRLMERGLEWEAEAALQPAPQAHPLGSRTNPLPRHEWIGLVMTHLAQHTDSVLQAEDFEVASR